MSVMQTFISVYLTVILLPWNKIWSAELKNEQFGGIAWRNVHFA